MADTPTSANNRFNFQQFLKPAWLAGVLSVGFHGVLFAAGPTFPNLGFNQLTEAEAAAERRNVPLVELTAAEQERLPDFSSSLYDFSAFSDLEPLSPMFGDQAGAPNADGEGSINSRPLLSPNNRSTPPSASRLPFGITRLEPGSSGALPFPSGSLPPLRNSGATPLPSDSATVPLRPTPDDSAAATQSPGAEALRSEADDLEVSAQEEAEIAANSNPTDTLSLEERLQAYTFDSANTETDAIATRFDEWLETGQALATDLELGDAEEIQTAFEAAATAGMLSPAPADAAASDADEAMTEPGIVQRPIELAIDYGAGICLTKEPQKGLIGAWVSPEGALLGEPEVIRSTGYLGLNQQAIRYIETLDFATVESFTGYQFEVVVNYDPEDCVDIGRSTPAAPTGNASPESDRSDTSSKAPAKAPAGSSRSSEDNEVPSFPATDGAEAAEDAENNASEADNPDAGAASPAETDTENDVQRGSGATEAAEPSDNDD